MTALEALLAIFNDEQIAIAEAWDFTSNVDADGVPWPEFI